MDGSPLKKRALPHKHKQATDSRIQNALTQANMILKHLAEAAQEHKVVVSNLNKKAKFLARHEVAKALGDRGDALKKAHWWSEGNGR